MSYATSRSNLARLTPIACAQDALSACQALPAIRPSHHRRSVVFLFEQRFGFNYKRDRLASEAHLERWVTRSQSVGAALGQLGDDAGFVADWPPSMRVARWSYGHAASLNAHAWVARDELEPLGERWQQLLD